MFVTLFGLLFALLVNTDAQYDQDYDYLVNIDAKYDQDYDTPMKLRYEDLQWKRTGRFRCPFWCGLFAAFFVLLFYFCLL